MEVKRDQTNSSVAKPTLLSTPRLATAANGGGDGHDGEARILFNLGAEPLTKKKLGTSSTRPGLKFFSLLGLSATAAFLGYQYLPGNGTPASAPNHTSAAPPAATTAATPTPVLAAATPVPLPVAPVAPPVAAQIINQSTASTATLAAPSRAVNDSKLTTALEEGVAPPTAAIQKALEDKAPVKASAEPKTANAQPVTKRKPAPVSPLAGAPVHTAKAKAKVKPMPPVVDEDVNLIAALIAHGDASTRLARAEAEQPVVAKTSDATAPGKKKKKKAPVSATSSQ